MIGLILKDLFVIRKTLLYMVVVTALFGGIYTSMDSSYFLAFFLSIMMVSVIISTVSYDEFYHWDRYAVTLPFSRRQLVAAKYLFTYAMFFLGTMVAVWFQAAASYLRSQPVTGEMLFGMAMGPAVGLLGMAVVLPCSYRFGVQRSRIIMLVLYGVPCLLLVMALKFLPELFQTEVQVSLSNGQLTALIAVVTVVLQAVSFLVSARIMEKKEF